MALAWQLFSPDAERFGVQGISVYRWSYGGGISGGIDSSRLWRSMLIQGKSFHLDPLANLIHRVFL